MATVAAAVLAGLLAACGPIDYIADAVLDPATSVLWVANYEASITRIDLR